MFWFGEGGLSVSFSALGKEGGQEAWLTKLKSPNFLRLTGCHKSYKMKVMIRL